MDRLERLFIKCASRSSLKEPTRTRKKKIVIPLLSKMNTLPTSKQAFMNI